jgi:hypothetical protein
VEKETDATKQREEQRDYFYHGVISKIFWSNETGVIRSDSGKEIPFAFPFVTLLGVPRQNINFLRLGMRVGFDVCRTSKGLRASVIKIYDLYQSDEPSASYERTEDIPHYTRADGGSKRVSGRGHPHHSHSSQGEREQGQHRHRRDRSPVSTSQRAEPQSSRSRSSDEATALGIPNVGGRKEEK